VITCHLAVCSDSFSVDQTTNRVSLFNLLDQLRIVGFPAVIPRMTMFFFVVREPMDPERTQATVTLRLGTQELFSTGLELNIGSSLRSRAVINLQGVVIPAPGTVTSEIAVNGVVLGRWETQCDPAPLQMTLPLKSD